MKRSLLTALLSVTALTVAHAAQPAPAAPAAATPAPMAASMPAAEHHDHMMHHGKHHHHGHKHHGKHHEKHAAMSPADMAKACADKMASVTESVKAMPEGKDKVMAEHHLAHAALENGAIEKMPDFAWRLKSKCMREVGHAAKLAGMKNGHHHHKHADHHKDAKMADAHKMADAAPAAAAPMDAKK